MYANTDVGLNPPKILQLMLVFGHKYKMTMKHMVTELQLINEKLQIQISEMNAGSSEEILNSPKTTVKVTKEVARTCENLCKFM